MQPLINGTAYSWSQIKLNILGANPTGVTAIDYSEEQEIQNNYGIGNNPVSRGYGAIKPEASITMHMAEVEQLQALTDTGRIQEIPEFDIVVSYLPENGNIVTHTLHNCRFKTNKRDVKQGDMELTTQINLVISHISWV